MTLKPRTFVLLFIGLLPCAVVLYMGAIYLFFATPQYSLWVHRIYQQKEALARSVPGPKWLVAGGSSVLFGVRAEDLEAQWGVPVINMGTHAGLMTDYMIWRLKRNLNPGDHVLLLMEYHNLAWDGAYSQERTFYSMTYDREFFRSLPGWEQAFMVLHIRPVDMFKALREQWAFADREKENPDTYHTRNLNRFGDDTNNAVRVEAKLAMARPYEPEPFKESKGLKSILDFAAWCRAHGIQLVVSYENIMDFPEYHDPLHQAYFNQLHQYLQTNGLLVVGEPYQFIYPANLFYDSMNHLNAEGAALRTTQLMNRMKTQGIP